MLKSVSSIFPENWGLIRSSNPFYQQLKCIDSGLLSDDAFEAPLPLHERVASNYLSHDAYLEAFHAVYPNLNIIALVGTSCEASLKPSQCISLIFVTSGEVCIVQDGLRWCSTAGSCLVVTGQALHWSSSAFSIVCATFPYQQLARLAEAPMISSSADAQIYSAIANQQVCIPSHDPITDLLISLFSGSLEAIGKLHKANSELVIHLDLAEHLFRLFSALISRPCIASPSELFPASPDQLRDPFDELLEYIQANLHQSLSLSVLEARSNYSRRTLQYAYRNRMGCTATQWIRSSRLELAHQLILMGSADDSVASIAMACGYRSMGLFSIEFQQRFHVKPSHLMRSAQS
jgi:AraC-like DNA-binding protein